MSICFIALYFYYKYFYAYKCFFLCEELRMCMKSTIEINLLCQWKATVDKFSFQNNTNDAVLLFSLGLFLQMILESLELVQRC